jgi:pyruvate,water dikinase
LADGDTASEPVAPELIEAPCLDDAALDSLQRLALRCEEAFEGPSDIEWAFAGDALYLLQRRAITRSP